MKLNYEKNIFLDLDNNRIYTGKQIRELDFAENINDLINNKNDIIKGIISVESVCESITNSLNADIEDVIKDLNYCWNYNIGIYSKVEEE